MKIKKVFTVLSVLAVTATNAFAQYENTEVYDRVAGPDSLEALQNLTLLDQNLQSKSYNDAYENYKFLIEKTPYAQLGIYSKGADLLKQMIQTAPDKETKRKYFDELMALYDLRIKNADGLNSFCKPKDRTTPGPFLCRKAYFYSQFGKDIFDDYSIEKAYNNYTEGINLVNEDPSMEIEYFVLQDYFSLSYQRYGADKAGFGEQFLNDYLLCSTVCEKMLAHAKEVDNPDEAKNIVDRYDPTYNWANQAFASSDIASRDQILAIYEPKIEANKDDIDYLKSALRIMASNQCDDADVYFKASEYAYAISPDVNSAIGMAAVSLNNNQVEEAINYYNKALELAPENDKAETAYEIANVLGRKGQISKAEPFLAQTEQLDPSYKGKCDLYRARKEASEKNLDAAIAYARKAGEEDPSISGTATRLTEQIETYKVQMAEYEAKQKAERERQAALAAQQAKQRAEYEAAQREAAERARAARASNNAAKQKEIEAENARRKAEYDRKMAEYNKRKAEYDAQVARQKKLDDFWKGK